MKTRILAGCAILCVLAAFIPAFSWMLERFTEHDSYYSHGFLIPLIAAFFVWQKRAAIRRGPFKSSPYGLPVIIAGLCLHLAGGILFRIGFLSGIGFVTVLFGLSLFLAGSRVTRHLAFPILFLLLMVPVPKVLLIGITFKLKMLVAAVAAHLLSALKITIERSGSIINLPNGSLTVGDECSGINSLISLFTLSVVFAYFAAGSLAKKTLFIVLSFPIALCANVARVMFLILAAYVYGVDTVISGPLHYGAGFILWTVALALTYMLWKAFTRPGTAEA